MGIANEVWNLSRRNGIQQAKVKRASAVIVTSVVSSAGLSRIVVSVPRSLRLSSAAKHSEGVATGKIVQLAKERYAAAAAAFFDAVVEDTA